MVCQACGASWDDIRAWTPRCALHGGPVCMNCCSTCEYRRGQAGIKICTYKDPLRKHAESMSRIQARETEQNVLITASYKARRREEARKRAIKNAMARRKEAGR